jgi:branched-chain amino acid transport system permease protein
MAGGIVQARRGLGRAMEPLYAAQRELASRPQYRNTAIVILLVILFLYPSLDSDSTRVDEAAAAQVFVLLALGLNIVVGFAGLLDLGYAAFFAIGAYTIALLGSAQFTVHGHSFSSPFLSFGPFGIHVNFFLLIPIAAATASLCGVLFGAPTLRLRGDYLAIVTLGFGEIVPRVIENLGPNNSLGVPNITNGVNRITGIDTPPPFHLFGANLNYQSNDPRPWYYLGLVLIIISVIIIYSLRNSRLGRAWSAIREDEVAAAHMGINITRARLMAFGLGAAFSGFGGVIEASRIGSVDYTEFLFNISITILVMVILGGIGSIPGAIIGAVLLTYLNLSWLADINAQLHNLGTFLHSAPEPMATFGAWLAQLNLVSANQLVFGIILVMIMLLRPQGIWPSTTRARELQPETAEVLSEENVELSTVRSE